MAKAHRVSGDVDTLLLSRLSSYHQAASAPRGGQTGSSSASRLSAWTARFGRHVLAVVVDCCISELAL